MWRSKPSLLRTWLRRWKANSWMQPLSTLMLKPSHTEDFLTKFLSSVVDFHAYHFPKQPTIKNQQKMNDTYSHTSLKELNSANHNLSSLKMSTELSQPKQQMEKVFSSMSLEAWNKWVMKQSQEYSQRKKLATHMKEKEYSSWATPRIGGADEKYKTAKARGWTSNLHAQIDKAINYPTPRVSDAEGGTVQALISESGQFYRENKKGEKWSVKLKDAVESWPTPTVAEGTKSPNQANYGQIGLSNHPSIVGLPTREKGIKDGKTFPTPMARDYKDTPGCKAGQMTTSKQALKYQQDQTKNNTNGSKLVLNPDWVEQLMGLPTGWTDLDYSATE